jgi:hypothetical protein
LDATVASAEQTLSTKFTGDSLAEVDGDVLTDDLGDENITDW